MVFYKSRVQAGVRRVGQANQQLPNAQANLQAPQFANQQMNAQANQQFANQQLMNNQFANQQLMNNQYGLNDAATLNLVNAAQLQAVPQTDTIQQLEAATNFGVEGGPTAQGGDAMVITTNNGQTLVTVEQTPQAQAVAPQALCEFPAQDVLLQRNVNITNTAPQLQNVETDICGNVVGYTETMTRRLAAGPWLPISGLQGNVENFVDQNGVLRSTDFNGNVILANSTGLNGITPTPQVVSNTLVGGKRAVYGSQNRAYGVAAMNKFRSA